MWADGRSGNGVRGAEGYTLQGFELDNHASGISAMRMASGTLIY